MAGDMQNVDMTDPASMTQGPGLAVLTAGTQTGAVTTLIKSILDKAVTADLTFATGGAKLYALSSTAVTNAGIWPHTINKAVVTGEDGEDVAYFNSNLFYSYNYTSVVAGDIGMYDLATTFVDDWGSTIPVTGATALAGGVPHQFAQTAEFLYVTNGQYITKYDATNDIMTGQGLDFPVNSEAQSNVLSNDRLIISVNQPDLTGSNKCSGSIYKWNRYADSWDTDSIYGLGRVGALYVKDGVVFVFHQDLSSTGGYHLGYINGNQVKNVASYKGSIPGFNQVTEQEGFIIWESSGLLYAWGSGDLNLDARLFQYMDGGLTTVGGIASPFGTILAASNTSTTNYQLAKASGYDTACNWKSMLFDLTQNTSGPKASSFVDRIVVNFDILAANARVDMLLNKDKSGAGWGGAITGRISYTGDGAVGQKVFFPKTEAKNFRLELDWSNGNNVNPVKINSINIAGHTL
uniref:Uncharacterized protein n=1 Tax=viral metagenome TaxID=1070528 RepID=A0A6M3IQ62_9ZZZZ